MPNNVLPGAPPTGGSGTPWGLVPQVPDPLASANTAITGDLANLPGLENLAGQVNTFNTQQAINPYIANLPGYSQMVGQSSQNIGSLLRGEIPSDVRDLLGTSAAERGVSTGLAGSPNANSALLRSLGLTSLGLQEKGEGELTSAIGRTPVPQLFNTAQFLTTPGDEQAAQMAANIYAAAPNPNMQAQALMDLFSKFMGRFSGGGVNTIDRGLGGGGGGGNYSSAGPTPGASGGGGGMPVTGRPGSSVNTGAIFGQNPGGVNFGGGPTSTNTSGDFSSTGMPSPDFLNQSYGSSPQVNDPSSPSYQWWNQQDPYSAMSGIDWGQPTNWSSPQVPDTYAQSSSPAYNWQDQSDPYSSLSGINWAQPTFWDNPTPGPSPPPGPVYSSAPSQDYYNFFTGP